MSVDAQRYAKILKMFQKQNSLNLEITGCLIAIGRIVDTDEHAPVMERLTNLMKLNKESIELMGELMSAASDGGLTSGE